MSERQYQDTLDALRECAEHFHEPVQTVEELDAKQELISLCKRIADDYEGIEQDHIS